MNTKIVYLYRDENNFKTFFDEVLAGSMTKEQETEILNLLAEEGVSFQIPMALMVMIIVSGSDTNRPLLANDCSHVS